MWMLAFAVAAEVADTTWFPAPCLLPCFFLALPSLWINVIQRCVFLLCACWAAIPTLQRVPGGRPPQEQHTQMSLGCEWHWGAAASYLGPTGFVGVPWVLPLVHPHACESGGAEEAALTPPQGLAEEHRHLLSFLWHTGGVSAPQAFRNDFRKVAGAGRSRSRTAITCEPPWHHNCSGKQALAHRLSRNIRHLRLFPEQENQVLYLCYQHVLSPQLKRNLGGWMAPRKAKGESTKASPVSLMCAWTCEYCRFVFLQEKAVVVARAGSPLRGRLLLRWRMSREQIGTRGLLDTTQSVFSFSFSIYPLRD